MYSTTANTMSDVRIVMIGRTGAGKSATGNTILGTRVFPSEARATSVTKYCSVQSQMINGRRVLVVDTPGLFDTNMTNDEVIQDVLRCITLAAPGPHVFLLTMSMTRFTTEEKTTVRLIQQVFGSEAQRHMIVLFTGADNLEETTPEDYIGGSSALKEVITSCNERYHVFNNREKSDRTQVYQLMGKIDAMMRQNQNPYYNYHMFTMANELNNTLRSMKEKDEIIAQLMSKIRALKREVDMTIQREVSKHICSIL